MTAAGSVYLAGTGAISAFGSGVEPLVDAVFAGRSGIAPRRRTAGWDVPTAVAAELPATDLATLDAQDLPLAMARAAALQALAAAGRRDGRGVALLLASTKGDLRGVLESTAEHTAGHGLPVRLARRLQHELGFSELLGAVSCACASGLVALGQARRWLLAGSGEAVLVVGVDALHEFVLTGFGSLHALDPGPCRPFDAARRGVTLGEAAAAILLQRPALAGAPAIVGVGGANDACHVTGPDRAGKGLQLAVQRALAAAELPAAAIDLVHLHGTATLANDATEALGLVAAFGGSTPPAVGSKAQTGHTLGAAGVLETLLALASLVRAEVPANCGLAAPDVHPGLDLVRQPRRLPRAEHALKVASGFGGVQAAVVLRR